MRIDKELEQTSFNKNTLISSISFLIGVLVIGILLYGIGNLFNAESYKQLLLVKNETVLFVSDWLMRLGSLIIAYFPFIVILRLATIRNSVISGVVSFMGYISFLCATLFLSYSNLPSNMYSSLFGITFTSNNISNLSGINSPLQTGLIGAVIVIYLTKVASSLCKKRSIYGFLGFIDSDIYMVIVNIILCAIAGSIYAVLFNWVYTYVLLDVISFISSDINNPASLFVYGLFDRVFSTLHLGNLIRNPFWFQSFGGTWSNLVGESVSGDVNIWTISQASNLIQTTSGRFITPYYVLNMFAIPAMIWSMYTIYTDKFEKRRLFLLFVLVTVVSLLFGISQPLEILMLLTMPVLYLLYVLLTSSLFALFTFLGVSIGFNYTGTSTLVAMPGTLLEFISYFRISGLASNLRIVLLVGAIAAIVYFVVTKIYFSFLAFDPFKTGITQTVSQQILVEVGGIENIKMLYSSINKLTVQVFDNDKVNSKNLKKLGAGKVAQSKAGFNIYFGASSSILEKEMRKHMRSKI